MANINEIAKIAGVSSATVSRVINRNGYVSDDTRAKVEAVIKKLDYVPNRNAVFLKTGMTKMLGIIAPDFSDSLTVFLRSFTLAAQKEGYNVTLFITGGDKQKELDAFEMLRHKQLDGLVLVIRLNDWDQLEPFTKYGPIVTWQRVDSKHIPSVFMNHYQGYMLGLEHLYASGCRNIANLYGSTRGLNTTSRMQAYADFCQKYKLDPKLEQQFKGLNSIEDGEAILDWYAEQSEKPDGFATSSDAVAAGLVAEARRRGYNIPTDFSVVGFDNIEISRLLDITTIDYPIAKQAQNAFTIIFNQLLYKNLPLLPLEFDLIKRKTTR